MTKPENSITPRCAPPSNPLFKCLIGQAYGKLLVIEYWGKTSHISVSGEARYRHYWLCECSCGEITVVYSRHLRAGDTKSCGCGQRRAASGLSSTGPLTNSAQEEAIDNTNTNNLRTITICGPDATSKGGDILNVIANSFIGLPSPGNQKRIGAGCTLVSSTSAGNSDGWNLDLLINDDGGFDQLMTRLKELEVNSVCRVAETPTETPTEIHAETSSSTRTWLNDACDILF